MAVLKVSLICLLIKYSVQLAFGLVTWGPDLYAVGWVRVHDPVKAVSVGLGIYKNKWS